MWGTAAAIVGGFQSLLSAIAGSFTKIVEGILYAAGQLANVLGFD